MGNTFRRVKDLAKNAITGLVFGIFPLAILIKGTVKRFREIPKKLIIAILIGLSSLLIIWFFFLRSVISDIDTITYDWRSKIAANKMFSHHDKDIILLAADDNTTNILERYPKLGIGRWPWQRKVWGDVVNFVSQGKPKAIVFDIQFVGVEGDLPENIASDKYFAGAVKNKNVVVAVSLSPSRRDNISTIDDIYNGKYPAYVGYTDTQIDELIYNASKIKTPQLRNDFTLTPTYDYYSTLAGNSKDQRGFFDNITFYGSGLSFEGLLNNASGVGVINLKSSQNTIFRQHTPLYRLVHKGGTSYLPSLPLAGALAALPEKEKAPVKIQKNKLIIGKREIPFDDEGNFLVNWHGKRKTYETVSVGKILLTEALQKKEIKNADVDKRDLISADAFKNKIVVIGQTSAGTDIHPTSMGSVYPGTEIMTTALDNILNDSDTSNPYRRRFIQEAPFFANFVLTVLFCSLVAILIRRIKSNMLKLQGLALTFISFVAFSVFMFVCPFIRISLNMTYPLLLMFLTGIITYSYMMHLENLEKKQIQNLFGKFVSPQVLEKLLKSKQGISRENSRKVMTVLFSDIRGFTTLSETIPAEKVILILNEYITEMVEVILKYNGTLDKYIGDAIMAFYNDPIVMEDHALRAVLTAVDMKKTLVKLNEKWQSEGEPTLSIGIGINTGEMIVGHIGSPRLVDYTVIGDNVNLASRLEGLTKEYGATIIISESTYNEVKEHIDAVYLDECSIKGRTGTVKIYEVKGVKTDIQDTILVS